MNRPVSPITPQMAGAVGDGVTNDTAALNRAISVAAVMGVGLFLGGTDVAYLIDDDLLVSARVHITSNGAKITQSGVLKNGFRVTASGTTIEGVHLYNSRGGLDWVDGTTTQARAINIVGADDVSVFDSTIENWGGAGVVVVGERCWFEDNDIIGIGAAGGLVDGSNSNTGVYFISSGTGNDGGCTVVNNRIRDLAQGIVGGLNATNLVLNDNTITNIIGQHGMYLGNGFGMTVVGNTIATCGDNGIKVAFAATATDSGPITIVGNAIRDVGADGIVVGDNTLNGVRMRGVVISGNSVDGALLADGIYINACDGFECIGNTVRNAAFGIRIDQKCRNGNIAHNYVENTSKAGLYAFSESTAYRIVVESNRFHNCGGSVAGSGLERSSIALGQGAFTVRHNRIDYTGAVPGLYFATLAVSAGVVCDEYENDMVVGVAAPFVDPGAVFNAASGTPKGYNARTDTGSLTIDPRVDAPLQLWTAAAANVGVIFATASAVKGDRFLIIKDYTSGGSFQIGLVSGTRVVQASERAAAEVVYDGTQWRMASFSILNTPNFIEVGVAPFASSGEIRGDATFSIKAINDDASATYSLLDWGGIDTNALSIGDVNGVKTVYLLNGAAQLFAMRFGATIYFTFGTGGLTSLAPLITFDTAAGAPIISQTPRTSDLAPQNFTITPQAPFATASGTNRDPSKVIVALAAPTNGGAAEGGFQVTRAGTRFASIGPYPGAPTVYGCLWLGYSTAANSGATCAVFSDGAANTYLNVPAAGTVGLAIQGVPKLTQTAAITEVTPVTLQFAQAVVAPKIWQATTGSGHGQDLTIAAQTSTFTNGNGGFVNIAGGTKTGAGTQGGVRIKDGAGTSRVAIDANGVGFNGQTPVIPNITGALSTVADAAAKAVLTSIVAALKNAAGGTGLATDGTT